METDIWYDPETGYWYLSTDTKCEHPFVSDVEAWEWIDAHYNQ